MSSQHFDEGHEPRRRFPARKMYPTLPGWFPTRKAPGQKIRTRLPMMMDGLIHIDTDPRCVRISPYPVSIRFFAHGPDGRFKVVQHIPDVGVKMADGSEVYIDFVPVNMQDEHPDFRRWEEELREAFQEQYGASYAVHDELCIYIKPRFGNLQTIWKHVLDGIDVCPASALMGPNRLN